MSFFYIQLLLSHVKTKGLNINDSTIFDRVTMPRYEECLQLVNPQGLPLGALSQSERIFLEFCQYWDSYPQEIKEVIKKW
jgi:hypothetical protein